MGDTIAPEPDQKLWPLGKRLRLGSPLFEKVAYFCGNGGWRAGVRWLCVTKTNSDACLRFTKLDKRLVILATLGYTWDTSNVATWEGKPDFRMSIMDWYNGLTCLWSFCFVWSVVCNCWIHHCISTIVFDLHSLVMSIQKIVHHTYFRSQVCCMKAKTMKCM